ncbi:regulatory protein TetR [Sphingobium chlorophenolicum L-1]|uniref:Regulatory protein TetR n=2 Tax=Sphingobium chlorophenolicum TaxID=46429 RepID=F6F1H4_SPHCR|nr:TetR/AcrR family transcriptional regulator [Sphingobium chlorophenolicum]AEG51390.1 regulatory protein TetR [Sphingobium chlorophenolicum L-1]KEQ51988.1 Regulatory protein TetR [Sphingobium chlorophenolicum]
MPSGTARRDGGVDLQQVRATYRDETRSAILAAAARILSEEGPEALTVRRVAEVVNASTKMIYTCFSGKAGLLDALYIHSFDGLGREFGNCRVEPVPIDRLKAMCRAYRAYAQAEPAFYNVMFGDLGRAYEAPLDSRRQAWSTFQAIRETVAACLPEERRDESRQISQMLWATMHGVVSLELRNLLGETTNCSDLYDRTIELFLSANGLS